MNFDEIFPLLGSLNFTSYGMLYQFIIYQVLCHALVFFAICSLVPSQLRSGISLCPSEPSQVAHVLFVNEVLQNRCPFAKGRGPTATRPKKKRIADDFLR